MLPKKHSHRLLRALVSLGIVIACGVGASAILLNRQHILDQIAVWQYQPSSDIASLADRAGMNDGGKFLYYASQPKLDGTQTFNNECQRIETSSAILGCYVNSRIYIYNVTDSQLDGIREVTAAHEMLHAAYQRMGDDEKKTVDALLEAEYTKLANDPDFQERMAFYARTEPAERDNELHSIIGTEVASISPELEAHYSHYFTNRQQVVALSQKYKSAFTNLTNQASQLATELDTLASRISAQSAQYNADVKTLNADIAAFNQQAASGGFLSQGQFNSQRATLLARVSALDAERDAINSDIATYNSKLATYNGIATQSEQLYNSINSTLAPAPSVE